jgi:hypothetical protein
MVKCLKNVKFEASFEIKYYLDRKRIKSFLNEQSLSQKNILEWFSGSGQLK